MSRFGGRVALGVVVVVAAVAGVVMGASLLEPDPPGTTAGTATADAVVDGMVLAACPDAFEVPVEPADYRPVAGSDPRLDATLRAVRRGRAHCVTSSFGGQPRGWRVTRYTVALDGGPGNYDETYTTSDARGSDELLNFPFATRVHGRCVRVDGEVVMTDRTGAGHAYHARLRLGPGCAGRGTIGG